MKKSIVFLVLMLAAITAKAEVIRIYAMDAVTLQVDLTKPTSDPEYLIAQTPAGQTVSTAGAYPWTLNRTFLRFDLSSIPDSAVVTDALMHMTVYGPPSTQESELQLAQRMSFDAWDDNAVDQEGYLGSTVTQLGEAARLLSANNTVTWNLSTASWDYASDIADNVLTMQVRYKVEGDYSYKGTQYYSHYAGWTANEWPYLELTVVPGCPSMDLTGDCKVDLVDFSQLAYQWLTVYDDTDLAAMASQWLTEGIQDMTWVSINDSGAGMKDVDGNPISHGGFTGEMSKYETTNAQYCQYLNTAKAAGQITVYNNAVYATSDTGHSQPYFSTEAASSFSQISYSGGVFSVRTREGYSMANHPVVMVSWYGATAFCDYYGYRLPTEWEWQAAADYDGTYDYGCGTSIDPSKANYWPNNPLGLTSRPFTSPVGYYPAYGHGVCDLAGNAWEWTSTVSGSSRGIRSGCWLGTKISCAVSNWDYYSPNLVYNYLGFRVCR